MWAAARLRSWSATVKLVSDVATDALCGAFPFGAGGGRRLGRPCLERVVRRAILARVLVKVVVTGVALRAAPVAGPERVLLIRRLALVADAPDVQLGSRRLTVNGLEPCVRSDRATFVVLAVVVVCAVVDDVPGRLVQAAVLRAPLRRLARHLWLRLSEGAVARLARRRAAHLLPGRSRSARRGASCASGPRRARITPPATAHRLLASVGHYHRLRTVPATLSWLQSKT